MKKERIHKLTKEKIHECVICNGDIEHRANPVTGEVYWTQGHNAQPVAKGRCCDVCNATAVMTARLTPFFGDPEAAASVANAIASAPKPKLPEGDEEE